MYLKPDIDKPIVSYCNWGRHSSLSYLLLRESGDKVFHYDGSWSEWSKDGSLPINSLLTAWMNEHTHISFRFAKK